MKVRRVCAVAAAALGLLPAGAQAQGSVKFLSAGDVDYLDPGQTYYTFGYAVQYAVNRTLYGFRPQDAQTPVPDLATGPPEISADNLTITVHLRPGVRYAPPVNREVVAADVEYAIERAFSSQVPSGYARAYFSELAGAPARPGRKIVDIPGVSAPDTRTLVLRLEKPVAPRVAAALVMPITVPVPREVAAPFDAKNPSTYDRHVAYSGPYMVTKRDQGKVIELARNPNWDRTTDFRPAYLDAITIEQGNDDLTVAARRTLEASRLLCCDSLQPPAAVLTRALRDRPGQIGRVSAGGTRWVAFNTRVAPFNRLGVRQGAIAGMDRTALRATRGPALIGPVAQHFLPPGMPGFAESGGTAGFADLAFMRHPRGDRTLARSLLRKAGYRKPRKPLLMIGTNADPGRRTAKAAAKQLRKLGFPIRLKLVPQDTLYTKYCGIAAAKVAICANVGWFKDFHDPESMLTPTFRGSGITSFGNTNWSQLKVPAIDRAMGAAELIAPGPDRDRAWAAVNHDITAQAAGAPYLWEDAFQLASADVEAVMNPYTTAWDLAFTRLR
jgi:peptide/nickel transport system substrate-binding protein